MKKLWIINDMVFYTKTQSMGLGVAAIRDILVNTVILCDPVRTFTGEDAIMLRRTKAYHLFFVDPSTYAPNNVISPVHLVLGPISIVNHRSDENCWISWEANKDMENAQVKLIAKRNISADEELFIRYHNIDEYAFK